MAELSNNPFIDHTASVTSRYPSLSGTGSPQPQLQPQYSNWVQPQQTSYGQPQQSQLQQTPPQQQYAPQQQWQQSGFQTQSPPGQSGFLPPSSFGQQFSPQVNGYNPQIPQQQQPQLQIQPTGYPQQQQYGLYGQGAGGYGQQQSTPYGGNPNLAQFDPYSGLTQQFSAPSSGPSPGFPNPTSPTSGPGIGPPGQEHPRQFIHSHKAELESWDPVSWKQAINSFESLKNAWDARRRTIEAQIRVLGGTVGAAGGFFGGGAQQYGGYGYNPQAQEIERLNALYKEAEGYVDTITASTFQMTEVQAGYRHSGDLASKRRVRESSNAALTGLPDWPPQTF
ncbi:hypothetical protein OF83DRAFT_1135983 [Amylostereum chailletii]|nr:hypothetical protein OF83DRAFT_1135983 [Amylostereum chailletii]